MPLDQLFFTFLYAFVPNELKKERNSAGESYYSLTMIPADVKLTVGNIQWLTIRCSVSDFRLMSLTVSDGSSVFTWELKDLKINPKLEDKLFEFKKPKEAEEVDLR
jgi:outer membrane lipoprotein-sorting protein